MGMGLVHRFPIDGPDAPGPKYVQCLGDGGQTIVDVLDSLEDLMEGRCVR